jgi:hypothetical protein
VTALSVVAVHSVVPALAGVTVLAVRHEPDVA